MRIFLLAAYLVAVSTDAAPFGCGGGTPPPRVGYGPERAFEIQVSNSTDSPVYVDLSTDPNSVVSCVQADGADCLFFDPFCTRPCGEVSEVDCLNNECDSFPRMVRIDAENPLILYFDGLLRVKNGTRCPGICIDTVSIPAGSYTLTLHAWTDYTCTTTECTVENSVIDHALPNGDPRYISLTVNAPRTEAVVFEIVK